MAVEVTGELDGVFYRCELTTDPKDPVAGSKRVSALVGAAIRQGRKVLLTPTGPQVPVSAAEPRSILRLLATEGQVKHVTGLPADRATTKDTPGVIR